MIVAPPGQVVYVTGSGQPSRGFESAIMQKVKLFWQFYIFRSFLLGFCHNYRTLMVLFLITNVNGEDLFVLSSLSPILHSSSEELSFSSLAICLLLLCSVAYCLTLIPLLPRQLCTCFL
jgi:hypothetical protein